MAEKKINNAEVMTEEQLDQVAGGTYKEYKELADLLPKVEWFTGEGWVRSPMTKSEVEEWLWDNLGIQANISSGEWNPFWNGKDNTYYRTTSQNGIIQSEPLTHGQVVEMIKAKLGK